MLCWEFERISIKENFLFVLDYTSGNYSHSSCIFTSVFYAAAGMINGC